MSVQTLIQIRRGTSTEWTSVNSPNGPVLSAGEFGYDSTNKRIKIGDGTTAWSSLDFVGSSEEQIEDIVGGLISGTSGIYADYQDSNNLLYISVTGIYSTQINDFDSAVDARVTAASISAEEVMDIVGGISGLYGNSGINVDYQDSNNKLYISVTGIGVDKVTDITADATEINYLDGTNLGTVSASNVVAVDSNKDITGFRNVTIDGNLTVNGTTTTVNSTTVDIGDNVIQVNVSGASTEGGFQILDHSDSNIYKLVWDKNDSRWEFSGGGGDIYTSGNFIGDLTGNADTVTNGVYTTDTGTVTSTMILDGTIVDADISSSALIAVSKLASSGITLGSTIINLSETSTVIDGLTRISGVSVGSPTYIYNAVIDGGTP